jgi:5-(carboxyamino)imidazole ribonucleotide synthase
VSVVAARGVDGTMVDYGTVENVHRHHILHLTKAPGVGTGCGRGECALTRRVMEALDYVGALCVFAHARRRLLVERDCAAAAQLGHYTIEACATSLNSEQQVRAVCGWLG